MNNNSSVTATATISFGSLCWLTWLVFLVLKLTSVLPEEFTWFWVWFPFWFPIALDVLIISIALIIITLFAKHLE